MDEYLAKLQYHDDPEIDDRPELWGIDYVKAKAEPAKKSINSNFFYCSRGTCLWCFEGTRLRAEVYKHVVGYDHETKILTIKCPKCGIYMWAIADFSPVKLNVFVQMVRRELCRAWPKQHRGSYAVKLKDLRPGMFLLCRSAKYPRLFRVFSKADQTGSALRIERMDCKGRISGYSYDIDYLNDSRVKATIATPDEVSEFKERITGQTSQIIDKFFNNTEETING